jgi:hypothetical protein
MSTGRGEEQDRVAISMGCLRCVLRGHRRGGTEDPKHDVNIYDEDIIKQDYDNGDHLGAGVDGHGDAQDERRDDGPGGGATGAAPSRWHATGRLQFVEEPSGVRFEHGATRGKGRV